MPETRPLRIFISYASQDRLEVQKLYQRLKSEPWIEPWFDKENLLPGQDWNLEIGKGLRAADVIIVCLSKESVAKEGYVQKEFNLAANYALEKPEGTIYVIPLRLDDCVTPQKFERWQWVDYFNGGADGAHERLLKALMIRARELKISITQVVLSWEDGTSIKMGEAFLMETESQTQPKVRAIPAEVAQKSAPISDEDLDLYRFIKITSRAVLDPFWIGKYPVTNAQYERFLNSDDFAIPNFWTDFPKFDEDCTSIGYWGNQGLHWLKEQLRDYEYFPQEMWKLRPRYWDDPKFGIASPDNPVVGISWYESNAYCNWLFVHWDSQPELRVNVDLKLASLRLPLETEWIAAAGGDKPEGRYPWDLPGKVTLDEQEILKRANGGQKIDHTTPVNKYVEGRSPFGVMDMVGNVWEWQANNVDDRRRKLALRGRFSWSHMRDRFRVPGEGFPESGDSGIGFRVVALPK